MFASNPHLMNRMLKLFGNKSAQRSRPGTPSLQSLSILHDSKWSNLREMTQLKKLLKDKFDDVDASERPASQENDLSLPSISQNYINSSLKAQTSLCKSPGAKKRVEGSPTTPNIFKGVKRHLNEAGKGTNSSVPLLNKMFLKNRPKGLKMGLGKSGLDLSNLEEKEASTLKKNQQSEIEFAELVKESVTRQKSQNQVMNFFQLVMKEEI